MSEKNRNGAFCLRAVADCDSQHHMHLSHYSGRHWLFPLDAPWRQMCSWHSLPVPSIASQRPIGQHSFASKRRVQLEWDGILCMLNLFNMHMCILPARRLLICVLAPFIELCFYIALIDEAHLNLFLCSVFFSSYDRSFLSHAKFSIAQFSLYFIPSVSIPGLKINIGLIINVGFTPFLCLQDTFLQGLSF